MSQESTAQESTAGKLLSWDTDDYTQIAASISMELNLPGRAKEDIGRGTDVVQDSSSGLEAIRLHMEHTAQRLPEELEREIETTNRLIKEKERDLADYKQEVDDVEAWPPPRNMDDNQFPPVKGYLDKKKHYENFKKACGLDREPRPPQAWQMVGVVILIFMVGESIFNMFTLYEAQEGGFLYAFAYAFGFSLYNVVLATVLGLCTRELLYRRWPHVIWRPPLFGVVWLVLVTGVVLSNLGFGRVRDLSAAGYTLQEAGAETMEKLKEVYILLPESIPSLFLVVIGGSIAVSVAYKTFTFIDPHPRFWAEHKALAEAQREARRKCTEENSKKQREMEVIKTKIEGLSDETMSLFRDCRNRRWITERVADHRLNRLALVLCNDFYKPAYMEAMEEEGPDSPPYLPPDEFNISVDKDKQEICAVELEKQAQKVEEVEAMIAEQRLRMTKLIRKWQRESESALAVAGRPAADNVTETSMGDPATS